MPCYNESQRIELEAFYAFISREEEIDFCFVNDGSRDNTVEVLQEAVERYPERLFLIDYKQNKGKAEAVRNGMLEVAAWERYLLIGFLDADLATPLEDIYLLRDEFCRYPGIILAMGARLKRLGANVDRKAYRHYMGRVFATAVSVLCKLPVYDSQCGAKLFAASVVPGIFEQAFSSPWLFDVEFLLRIRKRYPDYIQRVHEVPLNTWIEKGESRIRFSHLLKMPFELLAIYRKYR